MQRWIRTALAVCAVAALAPAHAQLQGRNLGGDAAFEAYYSPLLDVTFLANAGGDTPRASWSEAKAWAAGLNVYGVTGWRLPRAILLGSGPNSFELVGTNELAALNSAVLNHAPGDPLVTGPFINFATAEGPYWIDADPVEDPDETDDYAWHYVMEDHYRGRHLKSENNLLGWAVHDGDVTPVPEPASGALLLGGLAAMGVLARRRRRDDPA